MKPDLSIIVLSYNTKDITINCLESVLKYTKGIRYEIIVVDNGSTDGSLSSIKKLAENENRIKVVDAGENLGFGRGNNLGASKATGKYLLFLNSDTLLIDNALKECLDFVSERTNLGVYSPRLLNADYSIQPSGGYFPNLWNVFAWQLFIDDLPLVGKLVKSFHPQKGSYHSQQSLDWVTGAFMIIPKYVFDEVGGFDNDIFMYTEEMELIYRINQLGYKTYFKNKPSIIHLGGASGGSFLALTSEVKNMLYFWKKHKPSWQLPLVKLAFTLGSLLRLLLFGIIKGDEKSRRVYRETLKYTL